MRANENNRAWIVVVLLFIFMVINFADKAVIGIAAVPIMRELELDPRQFGLVGSSFFLLFAVSSVATGFFFRRAAVTSTQAVLWRLLCLAGIAAPITGFGRLLREHSKESEAVSINCNEGRVG